MTTTPYAKALMSIDGGALVSGQQLLSGNNEVQLQGESTTNWQTQLWQIYEYPTGFPVPTGWTNNNGVYESYLVMPPPFTVSPRATRWGKYLMRLVVNQGILAGVYTPSGPQPQVDITAVVQTKSPNLSLTDVGYQETNQFDPVRQWVGELKKTLRTLDSVGGGGGGSLPAAPTDPDQFLQTDGAGGIFWGPLTADQIQVGFSIGLASASGGASPIEVGATWTPTFNVSYSPDSTGLTAATISDDGGATHVDILSDTNPVVSPTTSYTRTAVNAVVSVEVTATRSGVTRTSNAISQQWEPKCWHGIGAAGATSLNGTTGALNVSGTLSGELRSSRVGSFGATPSGQKIYFACPASYGAVTFKDQNGFAFAMNSPTTITVVNQYGVSLSYNLYESQNVLNTLFVVSET